MGLWIRTPRISVNFIKDRMLTKDDVRDITRAVIRHEVPAMIREELKPLHHEHREINRRLDALDDQYRTSKV